MHVRALGVSLGHSIGVAIFGGTAEVVALSAKHAGHESAFYWYVAVVCGLCFLTTVFMREPRRESMVG
jgi:hypothetical protein